MLCSSLVPGISLASSVRLSRAVQGNGIIGSFVSASAITYRPINKLLSFRQESTLARDMTAKVWRSYAGDCDMSMSSIR